MRGVSTTKHHQHSRGDRTDRDVLLITIVLWAAHLGILLLRSAALNLFNGWAEAGIRLAIAALGAGSALFIYYALRHRQLTMPQRFAIAVMISCPLAIALAAINELTWLATTSYYQKRYGVSLSDVLQGRCSGGGCHAFLLEVVFTAGTFIWIYVSWSALYVGALFASELRDRDRRLAIAQGAAHQAQLLALRSQLSPHFLFNTLNTLSGLIALDRKNDAENVVLNLSNFLRYSLAGEPEQLVTLAEEMDAQRIYLEIERVRFADRLDVHIDVTAECFGALVPPFLLQPLVENAIKHAVAPSEQEVTLSIFARRQNDELVLRVENSAPTYPARGDVPGFGIGMSNIRKRLDALFGARASIEASPTSAEGWANIVKLPWMENEG